MNPRKDPCTKLPGDTELPARAADRSRGCCAVALLSGVGSCLVMGGLAGRLETLFGTLGTSSVVVAGGLFCLAVGPLLPHQLARIAGAGGRGIGPQRQSATRDEVLVWAVLAVVALLAGLVIAVLPLWTSVVESGYRWVQGRFLWPHWPLLAVQLLAVVVVALPGLALAGTTLSCACRLAGRERAWGVTPLGWSLVGGGVGLGLVPWLGKLGLPADAVCLAGAVPMLFAAVVSARRLGPGAEVAPARSGSTLVPVPDLRDRHPALIRFCVLWVAASGAAVVLAWPHVTGRWCGGLSAGGGVLPALLQVVAAGVGVMVCGRSGTSRSHSAGGLGVACAASGVGVAVAASVSALWFGQRSGSGSLRLVLLSAGAVCGFLLGFALAYGHRAVLSRVGHRESGYASLLSSTLAAWGLAALVLPLVGHSGRSSGGGYVLMAACAVSLVALGGVIIIHEPAYSVRTRRRRLAGVFASIVLMIGVLPAAGRQWAAQPGGPSGSGPGGEAGLRSAERNVWVAGVEMSVPDAASAPQPEARP